MGRRRPLRVVLRFLGLVAIPAGIFIVLLWRASDTAFEEARHRGLSSIGSATEQLLGDDLARATLQLSALAEPWMEADLSDPAVQRAMSGDTVRALRPRDDGVGVSLLLPAPQGSPAPILRADGRLRSRALEQLSDLTGVASAFYLNGRWLEGDSVAPAALLGEWAAAVRSAPPREGAPLELTDLGHAQLFGALGGDVETTALLVMEERSRAAPVSRASRIITGILLLFATAVVLLGLGPDGNGRHATRMTVGGLILFFAVMLGAGGWAVTRTEQVTEAMITTDLARIGALLRTYGRIDDTDAAARLTGDPVLRIDPAGGVASSDGSPVPPGAADLPTPPPSFPATGRLVGTDYVFLVLRGESGRTVLLRNDVEPIRPILVAGIGGLLLGLGLFGFLRGGLAPRLEEPDLSS